MSQSNDGHDPAALRAQFDADVRAAAIPLSDDDRERLFAMWADHLPTRDRLRGADVALEEEPSFIEKPTVPGGGVSPVAQATRGGAA